jgi:formylglycine-generating enzyme required for sulfatase activity
LLIHRGNSLQTALQICEQPKYFPGVIGQEYLNACIVAKKRNVRWIWILGLVMLILMGSVIQPFLSKEYAFPGKWVKIDPGDFTMGMDGAEAEFAHNLCVERGTIKNCPNEDAWLVKGFLPGFDIMDNEVTNAQYQQCVDDDFCPDPVEWTYGTGEANKPAIRLNWYEATTYCKWLGGRLPTESEWEKAARGPNHYYFPWGNVWEPAFANLGFQNGTENSRNIAQYAQTDSSGYEIKNLAGNVREWTASDCTIESCNQISKDAVGKLALEWEDAGKNPVIVRGGSWVNTYSIGMTTMRWNDAVSSRKTDIGFRCACPNSGTCSWPWWTRWWIWFGKY